MTRKQISLREDTYSDLEELKRQGQSFDGIVQELLDFSKLTTDPEVEA